MITTTATAILAETAWQAEYPAAFVQKFTCREIRFSESIIRIGAALALDRADAKIIPR